MSGRIKVISERIMSRGYEPAVASLMEAVKAKVRAQPGLLSVTTYNQLDQSNKYVVFSEVSACTCSNCDDYVMLLRMPIRV